MLILKKDEVRRPLRFLIFMRARFQYIPVTTRTISTFLVMTRTVGPTFLMYSCYLGKLVDITGGGKGYANMIDMAGNHQTGRMLFVAQKENEAGEGMVHLFRGDWNQWTQVSKKIYKVRHFVLP